MVYDDIGDLGRKPHVFAAGRAYFASFDLIDWVAKSEWAPQNMVDFLCFLAL